MSKTFHFFLVFSLFSVVQFKNEVCDTIPSAGSSRNGTCYTTSECANKAGTAQGNCAAGWDTFQDSNVHHSPKCFFHSRFGVCCYFAKSSSGSTISENNTYIQNPGYPSTYSSTSTVSYTVNKCSPGVCSIRLDFESFTTLGPASSNERTGTPAGFVCTDSFKVTGSSGATTPVICGKNTGQHIYVDIGVGTTDSAAIEFTFSTTTSTTRTWDILVSQIPCAANYREPSGCLQYHTGLTGRFTTFNFLETTTTAHLGNQE